MRQVVISKYESDINTHVTTTWKYYKDENMEDPVLDDDGNPVELIDSLTMLNVWYVPSPVSEHLFFVFYKRGYDNNDDGIKDSEDDEWGKIEIVPQKLQGAYLSVESYVEAPALVGATSLTINDYKINVELSEMKPDIVPHEDTTYIVKRLNNEIVYMDLNNQTNLTSCTIELDPEKTSKYEDYVLIVIFRNKNRVVSQPLVVYVNAEDSGVEPTVSLDNIIAEINNTITLSNPDGIDFEFKIIDETGVELFKINDNSDFVFIPAFTLDPDKSYDLTITIQNDDGENVVCYQNTLTTRSMSKFKLGYSDTFTLQHTNADVAFDTDVTKYYLEPLSFNTNLFYTSEENKLVFGKFLLNNVSSVDTHLELPESLSDEIFHVIHMRDDRVFITGTKKDDGTPYWYTLRYNVSHFSLSILEQGELSNIDFNNELIGFSSITYNPFDDKIYFIGVEDDIVGIYYNDNGYIEKVTDVEKQGYKNYVITFVDYDTLFITASGTDDNDEYNGMYLYSLSRDTFVSIDTYPEEFKDADLVLITLPNNSILCLDTLGTNEDYLIVNLTTNAYEIKTKDDDYKFGNRIVLTNNDEIYILKDGSNTETNRFG